jgi:hypothetical protein
MQRRGFLKLGVGAAVVIGVAGAGVALIKPGLVDGKLGPGARDVMRAAAQAVLADLLPPAGAARDAALVLHLDRLEAFIASLPAPTRKELSDALGLLATAAGRFALVGLSKPWAEASAQDVTQALDAMRLSSSDTKQQIYHALRDLNAVVFFNAPDNWQSVGYPGPVQIP